MSIDYDPTASAHTRTIQFWTVSGYEATATVTAEPATGTILHTGTNTVTKDAVWVYFDDTMQRWQEVDPSMKAADFPTAAQ